MIKSERNTQLRKTIQVFLCTILTTWERHCFCFILYTFTNFHRVLERAVAMNLANFRQHVKRALEYKNLQ